MFSTVESPLCARMHETPVMRTFYCTNVLLYEPCIFYYTMRHVRVYKMCLHAYSRDEINSKLLGLKLTWRKVTRQQHENRVVSIIRGGGGGREEAI